MPVGMLAYARMPLGLCRAMDGASPPSGVGSTVFCASPYACYGFCCPWCDHSGGGLVVGEVFSVCRLPVCAAKDHLTKVSTSVPPRKRCRSWCSKSLWAHVALCSRLRTHPAHPQVLWSKSGKCKPGAASSVQQMSRGPLAFAVPPHPSSLPYAQVSGGPGLYPVFL